MLEVERRFREIPVIVRHEIGGGSDMAYYVTIWQFDIHPSMCAAFEQVYGPDGAWITLFRHSPDYVRTDLVRDTAQSNRYLTLDYWQTQAAYTAFQTAHQAEYAALDVHCSQFTMREVHIGSFISVSCNPPE